MLVVTASFPAASSSAAQRLFPIKTVNDIVVDPETGNVFVSGAQAKVWVFDLEGGVVGSIDFEPDARPWGLAIDQGTLYVALAGARSIAAYDTATLAPGNTYPVAPNGPESLEFAGGRLWFESDCTSFVAVPTARLVALDPATGVATQATGDSAAKNCGPITVSPADPNLLVVSDATEDALFTYAIDPTSPAPAVSLLHQRELGVGFLNDFDISPDGKSVAAAHDSALKNLDIALEDRAGYASAKSSSVAYSPTDDVIASFNPEASKIEIYTRDSDERAGTIPLPADIGGAKVLPNGLAFTPDGNHLFAVASDGYNDSRVVSLDAHQLETSLGLSVSKHKVGVGDPLILTAHLDTGGTASAGAKVTFLVRKLYGRRWFLAGRATTNTEGIARTRVFPAESIVVRAVVEASRGFQKSISDDEFVQARALLRSRLFGATGESGGYKLVRSNSDAAFVVQVIPPVRGTWVAFTVEVLRRGRWRFFAEPDGFTNNRHGVIGLGLKGLPNGRYRIHAEGGASDRALSGRSKTTLFQVI
jgi:sugar lactone lactonase YvrE